MIRIQKVDIVLLCAMVLIFTAGSADAGSRRLPDGVAYRDAPAPIEAMAPFAGTWEAKDEKTHELRRTDVTLISPGWVRIRARNDKGEWEEESLPVTTHVGRLYLHMNPFNMTYRGQQCYWPTEVTLSAGMLLFAGVDIDKSIEANPWAASIIKAHEADSTYCGLLFGMSIEDQERLVLITPVSGPVAHRPD